MKSLTTLDAVATALANIQKSRTMDHDNGTFGKHVLASFYSYETVTPQEKRDLQKELIRWKLLGKKDKVRELQEKIDAIGADSVTMIFKLVTPIDSLTGTKAIPGNDGKVYHPVMKNVEYVYIPQDVYENDSVTYEETKEKTKDSIGNDVPIVDLILCRSIIDVSKEEKNSVRVWKEARAYVTDVSFRAMQVVGRMMASEQRRVRDLWGTNYIQQ